MLTHVTFKYVYNFYLVTDLSHPNTSQLLAQKGMHGDGRWRTHSLNISSSFFSLYTNWSVRVYSESSPRCSNHLSVLLIAVIQVEEHIQTQSSTCM